MSLDPKLFDYDEAADVWVARGMGDFAYADGSEDYLAEVFESVEHVSDYPVEFADQIRDWPSRYHLSHQRVNLMDSISELIDPSWSVLELGAGPGALTKWLAGRVAHVDVIEGSRARAAVNRRRTREDTNVRVMVGNIVDAPIPETYDMATLIGVLEYGKTREGCLDMLRKVRSALTGDGVLILAIENRLGAKYWAGCREDHCSRFFEGLLEYPNADSPITFSRRELQAILSEAGFAHQQFYHAFPDYKLPTVMFRESDEIEPLRPYQWAREFAEEYTGARLFLFPDPLLLKSVSDAGLLWEFSNSFVVACSVSERPALETSWLVRKYWNKHRPETHHTISLYKREGQYRIERAPLGPGLDETQCGDYRFSLKNADYVNGVLLTFEVYSALVSERWFERVSALAREVQDEAKQRFWKGEVDDEGYPLLHGASLDFAFWNLVRTPDGSLVLIDEKWECLAPIPADYLMFRNLLNTFGSFSAFVKPGPLAAIRQLLEESYPQITDERIQAHFVRETDFQSQATGRESEVKPPEEARYGANAVDRLSRLEAAAYAKDKAAEQLAAIAPSIETLTHLLGEE
ncbi:MAG: class I SAM-dependent methyltransferase [Actinomycetota bacterium]|nr:class I SAM-dependent methyltransferase [Actinomycetota bacterium]